MTFYELLPILCDFCILSSKMLLKCCKPKQGARCQNAGAFLSISHILSIFPTHKILGVVEGSQLHKTGQSMGLDWAIIVTYSALSGPSHQFD